jgi:lipopolysaccharide biosynthesis glycosyltransferase
LILQLYRELVAAAYSLPSEEAEQSALNEYFHGRWQHLPYTFNFQKHPGTSPSRLEL